MIFLKMNNKPNSMRLLLLSIIASLCFALVAISTSVVAQEHEEDVVRTTEDEGVEEVVTTGSRISHPTTDDLNARSEFRSSQIVANQYLVVTLKLTRTSIEEVDARLMRGPGIRNSASDDLRVRWMKGNKVDTQYSIQDPRFRKQQQGPDLGAGYEWFTRPVVEKKVFVPLDPSITKVSIVPAPGREGAVASGGEFDPRPLASYACREHDPLRYPDCEGFPSYLGERVFETERTE